MEMEHVPFNLNEVVARCQSVILPDVKEKGLELMVYTDTLDDKKLIGDPLKLYQTLLNLLSNAVKFTDSGIVSFSSMLKSVGNGSATVYFEVKDSGIGMTPEQINKIFDPFIQADSSTTRDYGGTGLGIEITKNIVELMGGKLTVESTPGAGSAFSFELVFETLDTKDDLTAQEESVVLKKPLFDNFALICDDNFMNQDVIREHLARVGIKTTIADNGKIGVDMVRERQEKGEPPFDLIFMDMFMPVMDGMEASSKIRALDIGTPIIAMTANIMSSELEKYKKHGMPDCLGKPFTPQELWRILLKYLTPISSDHIFENGDNGEMLRKVQINFVNKHQNIHEEIAKAITIGDTELAHRLAHTLKGNAGLIDQLNLKNAAEEVEALLAEDAASILENKMSKLKNELTLVLDELKPLLYEPTTQKESRAMNAVEVLELLENLRPMLENSNPECAYLTNDIRAVPGGEELARLIESFDFKLAVKELANLRKELGKNPG
jgi:CheY-like chemotaxis protein